MIVSTPVTTPKGRARCRHRSVRVAAEPLHRVRLISLIAKPTQGESLSQALGVVPAVVESEQSVVCRSIHGAGLGS